MEENLNVTFDNLPSMVSQLLKKINNIESLLLMKAKESPKDDLINVKEACELLNLSVSTIYSKCSRKELPYHKPNGTKKLMFKRSELIEYLDSGRVQTEKEYLNEAIWDL